MTYKGGWENYRGASFDTPPAKPHEDSELQITGSEEGRFRCIRRVDGRIESTTWKYETAGADDLYSRERRKASQRERLKDMNIDELRAELDNRELDCLSFDEVMREFVGQRDTVSTCEDSEAEMPMFAEGLIKEIADRDGPGRALTEFRELKEATRD
ncbi:hypothetical protein [Salinigranum rubrum]|uniref:hypothetical protein n=1 Tax=Salinigranum rubrum TaxID=755307 RepID=UPI0013A58E3E|nr:hypothetical protein [Salinigranum rubrum]